MVRVIYGAIIGRSLARPSRPLPPYPSRLTAPVMRHVGDESPRSRCKPGLSPQMLITDNTM